MMTVSLRMLLIAWGTVTCLQSVSSLPEVIKLAGLFDTNSASQEASFLRAVDAVNDDRTILTKSLVSADVGRYPADDSFKASKKLCEIIQPGVSAVFGPTTEAACHHVQALSDTLHVPFMQSKYAYIFKRADFSISVHPHPSLLSKAFADFVRKSNWRSLIVLYETEDGLVKLQELLKLPKTFHGLKITLRQLTPDTLDYRPLLKEIKKSEETRIVLDCDYDKIALILAQADELSLLTDYHNYLVTSLDVDKINLDAYVHHNVNITGFRLIDPDSSAVHQYLKKFPNAGEGKENYLFTENALVHDAVRVYAKALNDLDSLQEMEIQPLSCDAGAAWEDGEKVLGYIKEVEYVGLSGEIKFDSEGFRTKFPLDLMEKVRNRLKKTAVWTEAGGVNYTLTATEMIGQAVMKLQNKTLRITTTGNDPYVMKKIFDPPVSPEALQRMSFEEKYEGFCVDLIKELSKEVKFKYKFYLVEGGGYGSFKNGRWTGMIADLRAQKADLAVIDMSITSIRQTAVDFTMPYMSTGVGILYKKKIPPPPNPFSFLQPLSIEVWIYTTTAYLGVSIVLFLLARISPYEWEDDGEGSATNQWTISNALWFGIGSFLCQGCDILPKTISTRTVAIMWWFFTLIMMSSYTANLAAFLTASKMSSPVNSAEDLSKQTKIKFGTYCCGSTNSFFRGSTIPTYQKLNAFMESAKPSVYTSGNSAGIDRVRKEDGLYAFFMEAAAIEYHIERKCDLKQLGGLLDSKGYGIALPKDSPYTQAISQGVIRLIEKGVVTRLKKKWWEEQRGGGSCKSLGGGGGDQMSVAALAGLYMMLIGGMVIATMIAICEFTWRKRKLAVDENTSVWLEMWEELKFAINPFAGDTKANPMACDSQSASRASSKAMLSKSTAESLHKYGQIGDELSLTKARKDSVYERFNDQS
eukprot:GFUD01008847.1.p1 GENE.GFUD01008847.1~~GFUD01008847.1.p1  ORF type:complete len:922 (+),score=198.85 GFUD01008847.1:309-3074(+)